MTLISVRNSDGSISRCTSRCQNAVKPKCTCCCGGMNHGIGLEASLDLTAKYGKDLRDNYALEHPDRKMTLEPIQQELFVV